MGIDVRVSSFASWITNEIAVVAIVLPGDYNGDGLVDMKDYTIWADNFGWTGLPGENAADGNNDGVVNLADYSVWADQFRNTPSGTVPEPTTLVLLGLGGVVIFWRRKKYSASPR